MPRKVHPVSNARVQDWSPAKFCALRDKRGFTLTELRLRLIARGVTVGLATLHGWGTHLSPKRSQFKVLRGVLKAKTEDLLA